MKKIMVLLIITILAFSNITFVCAGKLKRDNENIEIEQYNTNNEGDIFTLSIDPNLNVDMEEHSLIIGDGSLNQVDETFLNTYAAYYFSQLTSYFGYNYKGTCSYVAMSMLLSFYNIYWDDSIIMDSYEENLLFDIDLDIGDLVMAPGIKNEKNRIEALEYEKEVPDDEQLTDDDYNDFILSDYLQYFHINLLHIGTNILNKSYAAPGWDIKEILEYYLYNEAQFDPSEVTVEFKDWYYPSKRQYIIEKVTQGIPVIVCAGDINNITSGHSYIIYDYDQDLDELYCHTGWRRNLDTREYQTHVPFSAMDETILLGLVTIEFYTEHSCSNNYTYVEDRETKSKCSCYFPCHPEHEHEYEFSADGTQHTYACGCHVNDSNYYDHTFEYTSVDSDAHMLVCSECEYSYTAEHNMRYKMYASLGKHGYKCVDCGYVDEDSLETHSYDYWVYLNPTTHISECTCGARGTTTANHVFSFPDETGQMVCRGCGYTKYQGGSGGNIILSKQKVSLNGSYILPDGNIVLVDEDVEAYLNGTLVFYDKDKLPVTH